MCVTAGLLVAAGRGCLICASGRLLVRAGRRCLVARRCGGSGSGVLRSSRCGLLWLLGSDWRFRLNRLLAVRLRGQSRHDDPFL